MGYDLLGKIYHGNVGRDRGWAARVCQYRSKNRKTISADPHTNLYGMGETRGCIFSDFYRHIRAHMAAKDVGGDQTRNEKRKESLKKKERGVGETPHTHIIRLRKTA